MPFDPARVTRTAVGNGTLTFADLNNATFTYTVNGIDADEGDHPVPVRSIACPARSGRSRTSRWRPTSRTCGGSPNGAESGWGINLAHQGDIIFGSWYTYDLDGSALWLSVTAPKVSPGVYSGQLIRVSGPPFGSVPFDSAAVIRTVVGTATFSFANGNAATFAYVVNGVAQSKAITRFLFLPPSGTLCQ